MAKEESRGTCADLVVGLNGFSKLEKAYHAVGHAPLQLLPLDRLLERYPLQAYILATVRE